MPDAWQVITEMTARLSEEVDDDDGIMSAAELTLQLQEKAHQALQARGAEAGERARRRLLRWAPACSSNRTDHVHRLQRTS